MITNDWFFVSTCWRLWKWMIFAPDLFLVITFHLSGKVNRHIVLILGLTNPHTWIKHERDSPKVNFFCAMSVWKIYGLFFFTEKNSHCQYLFGRVGNLAFSKDLSNFVSQQDGSHSDWATGVRCFLNTELPRRWIRRWGSDELMLHSWPPRSTEI